MDVGHTAGESQCRAAGPVQNGESQYRTRGTSTERREPIQDLRDRYGMCEEGEKQMLEFQENFFLQEIREGFYVDRLMKATWAAEMEVLQRVAEVCDRHGIIWYAAYGTLLGAIRHEGFVPWDDDMDIWVKRKDYNRLVQLLPEELPEGYSVRSPLSPGGLSEYHMLVQNSRDVHMDKEWLEQYHGCPFSAGVDIFPLDSLPRGENDLIVQKNMGTILARGGQLALLLYDGIYENLKNQAEEKRAYVEEIWEGIRYLESTGVVRIDPQLVIEEKWEELSSEFWKWTNYFAMLYEEEESDYLVYFLDYVRWPKKKFPREWFAEAYSAKFENFMLPIPCEYDQVLRRIYGDYTVVRKKGGMHDYPYFSKQLDAIQRWTDESLQAAGVSMDTGITPGDWEQRMIRDDGGRKKVVLYINDISDFITYGEEALDKLESVLQVFYEARERILLWWRPHEEMCRALTLADQKLAARYSDILKRYKMEGWGICDESSDRLRPIEICDAYYGAENSLVKQLCSRGKPVMVGSGR